MPTESAILDVVAGSLPTLQTLDLAFIMFLSRVMAPFPYAMERFRGFGRVMVSKLPYAPPPGQNAEEALAAATAEDDPAGSRVTGASRCHPSLQRRSRTAQSSPHTTSTWVRYWWFWRLCRRSATFGNPSQWM